MCSAEFEHEKGFMTLGPAQGYTNTSGSTAAIKVKLHKVRVKSGNFGHQVNSGIPLQTVEIQIRRLLMSRLIKIFTVCLVYFLFFPIIKIGNEKGSLSEFT